jgi:thiamine biosynthesis protein ThiI
VLPEAQKIEPSRLKEFIIRNGKEKTYLLFCRKGMQSAHWSRILRSEGVNAFYTTESDLLKTRSGKEVRN